MSWGTFSIAAATLLLSSACASSPRRPTPARDCEEAKRLAAGTDEEWRRIVCEIPAEHRKDVSLAQVMGRSLREHDVAAWTATDALRDRGQLDGVEGGPLGWLTLEGKDTIEVRFFVEREGKALAFASATYDRAARKTVRAAAHSPPEPATPDEQRMLRAKLMVLRSGKALICTDHPPNTVVTKAGSGSDAEILVFVMSGWVDLAPLGGFDAFVVNHAGDQIVGHFRQTDGCPMVDLAQAKGAASLSLTHHTSPTPTAFHVFLSLQYQVPLVVLTRQNRLFWSVEGDRISLVEADSELGKAMKRMEAEIEAHERASPTGGPTPGSPRK